MTQMQGEATTTNQSPSPPASSLLVVDDNSMNRIMLSRYISKLGPVIMISAAEELESVVRCIELGAQDYLPKPFNPVLLRARLSECLERKRMSGTKANA
jgi:DNA-binding response OmpR family regulator